MSADARDIGVVGQIGDRPVDVEGAIRLDEPRGDLHRSSIRGNRRWVARSCSRLLSPGRVPRTRARNQDNCRHDGECTEPHPDRKTSTTPVLPIRATWIGLDLPYQHGQHLPRTPKYRNGVTEGFQRSNAADLMLRASDSRDA